jgi:hypothetical protein
MENLVLSSVKKVQVVFMNTGENRGSHSEHAFLESFTGDLDEKCSRCANADFNMLVEDDLYRVKEVLMPEWFTEQYYLRNYIQLRFARGLGGSQVYGFNRTQFENFIKLGETLQFWFGWSAKSKSGFVLSLRGQFDQWLANEDNKYNSPLSAKQIDCAYKFCPTWEAKSAAAHIYRSKGNYTS